MKVVFRLTNGLVVNWEPTPGALASVVVGHTVELEECIYEIVGVRLVPDARMIIVTLDDTGGRSTMPPPPGS